MPVIKSNQKVADWWDSFKNSGDQEARNKLIEYNLPLVKHIAQKLHIKLLNSSNVRNDELISAGHIGLISAIDNFDPSRGVAFSTFAWFRIRGAMLDDLRESSWIPRLVRKHAQRFEQANHILLSKFGRMPTEQELMCELKISPREFVKYCQDAHSTEMVPMQNFRGGNNPDEQDNIEWALPISDKELAHDRLTSRREVRDMLLRELTRTEYFIIVLYYHEGLRMREIARILEISESRISQKHSKIISRFKRKLQMKSHVQTAA